VLHIFLAMTITTFSLGIVVLVLGILSYRRSGRRPFFVFTLLSAAAIIYLILDMIRLYSAVAAGFIDGAFPWVAMVLSGAANGLAGFAVPALVFAVVGRQVTRGRAVLHAGIVLVMAALGILDDLVPLTPFLLANTAALASLQVYGAAVVLGGFRRIEGRTLRGLARAFLIIILCGLPFVVTENVSAVFPGAPRFLREFHLAEIAYFLALTVLLIVYALRYLFKATPTAPEVLSDHFIEKYGISPREREIISMILQGFGNKKISETLFISAMTVKNHIYHIYQKTGAQNKIQLINIINS
jgi:DNA-binding CsgD family transcriptional regulator